MSLTGPLGAARSSSHSMAMASRAASWSRFTNARQSRDYRQMIRAAQLLTRLS